MSAARAARAAEAAHRARTEVAAPKVAALFAAPAAIWPRNATALESASAATSRTALAPRAAPQHPAAAAPPAPAFAPLPVLGPSTFSERVENAAVRQLLLARDAHNPIVVTGHKAQAAFLAIVGGMTKTVSGDMTYLKHWLPDGYGITIYVAGTRTPAKFRDVEQAAAFMDSLPPGSVNDITFYGHGAPGFLEIGPDYLLEAPTLVEFVGDKMSAEGSIHLIGCNTASPGEAVKPGEPLGGPIFFGLSTLARRIMYFSIPHFEGIPKDQLEQEWARDLALEVNAGLPNVAVQGFRTFAFPLDRLVPGNANVTPSEYILGRDARYRNGQEELPRKRRGV